MREKVKEFRETERGQTSIVRFLMGALVASIVGVQVFIPTIHDAMSNVNMTGTTESIVSILPMFVGLLLLVAVAGPLVRQM